MRWTQVLRGNCRHVVNRKATKTGQLQADASPELPAAETPCLCSVVICGQHTHTQTHTHRHTHTDRQTDTHTHTHTHTHTLWRPAQSLVVNDTLLGVRRDNEDPQERGWTPPAASSRGPWGHAPGPGLVSPGPPAVPGHGLSRCFRRRLRPLSCSS